MVVTFLIERGHRSGKAGGEAYVYGISIQVLGKRNLYCESVAI